MNWQATLAQPVGWTNAFARRAAPGAPCPRLPTLAYVHEGDHRIGNGARWKRFLIARTMVWVDRGGSCRRPPWPGTDHD